MTFTRAQVIQALTGYRRRQIRCIRAAEASESRAVCRAFGVIAAASAKMIVRLKRALRESKSASFESE